MGEKLFIGLIGVVSGGLIGTLLKYKIDFSRKSLEKYHVHRIKNAISWVKKN